MLQYYWTPIPVCRYMHSQLYVLLKILCSYEVTCICMHSCTHNLGILKPLIKVSPRTRMQLRMGIMHGISYVPCQYNIIAIYVAVVLLGFSSFKLKRVPLLLCNKNNYFRQCKLLKIHIHNYNCLNVLAS